MTSNLKHSLRSLRLGLALIFTLFLAVASWAADGSKIYESSVQDKSRLSIGGYQVSQGGSWSSKTPVIFTADDIQIQTANTLGHDGYFICLNNQNGSGYKSFEFTISSPNETKYIKRVTIHYLHKTGSTEYTASATAASATGAATGSNVHTLTASVSVERKTEYRLLSFEVEFTDQPYYSVTPAEGLEISNTDDACLVFAFHNGFTGVTTTTYYFHPDASITIAPTSAVQVITEVTTPTTGATLAADKRGFSFEMPASDIAPSATLVEAHPLTFSGNVSISEPLFTYDGDNYYKSGDLITVTTTKTNEIIDGITGIADYTIADDKKSATFTMPTSDLTLAVTTFEVYTMSVPSGMTLSDPYITIGDVKYYKKGETYTLTAPQYNIIDGFTATGAQSSSVSSDKRSATVTIGSANVTATATLYEVHTMNIAGGMTLSPPFITIAGVKYYRKGGTYIFTAPEYNIIESFTATGALSSTISADKRTAKVTVGTANVTTTASLTEVHTLSVPDGMTLSAPYTTIDNVKYYKRGETYTFTAPEYNIIESFTAMMADDKSVSSDKRSATVTIGKSDVDPIAELTEVHTVTAQDGITLSEAYTNILGTDYYKYGQEVTFGFSGSGSMVYCVNGECIEGNSVTVDHENLTVQMGVPYIDENGEKQVRKPGDFTVLASTTDVSFLPGGWYVVQGEVSYTSQVYFRDNAYLILADGAKMEIETEGESENGIYASKNLTIYGQSGQSGILKASAKGSDCFGIYSIFGNVTISGGTVAATGNNYGIYSWNGSIMISGGTVTATSESEDGIYSYEGVTISGGTVTATGNNYGIRASKGDITLSWTNPTDKIKASSYYSYKGSVQIAAGKSFTDEDGKVYSGTLNSNQLSAIRGKTLTPASIKYVDENGNEKSIYEFTVLTGEMAANVLPGGWYVLENSDPNNTDLSLTNTLWFNGDVNLILADGADMGVVVEKGDAINVAGKLTVYGQSNQTGTLYAIGSENGINAENGIVVNGGCVKAYGGDYKYGFNGGENGVDIHLKHYNSYILGSSYREPVTVSGLALHGQDNNGIYEGDLDKAQIENMAYQYQLLEPCYVVKFDKDNNTDPEFLAATFNKEGVAHVAKPEVPTREGYTFLEWVDKPQAESTSGVIRKRFDFTAPVKQNTYVYAKWWKNDPVQYVAYDPDEGKVVTKTVEDYTVLTPWTDVSKGLPAEWYIVVNSNEDEEDDGEVDLRFTKQLDFNSETTHIILMDDAQMVVGDDMNSAIHANVLNIYGQSIGSGKLVVNSDSWAIEAGSFNIYGGIVHAFGKLVGIYSYNTAHLYGGYVYVANGNYGICVNKGDLILDWTRKDDGYNINGYVVFDGGSVVVAEGKYFTDEKGRLYSGTLSDNQITAISHQTIEPLPWKNLGDYAAVQIFEDENGKKHAVIDGEYEGKEPVYIPNEIAVDAVDYIRDFDANTPSTVLLPFSLPSCATVNAKFYTLDNVSQLGNKWVATVASIGNALPEANTAYAVMLPTDGRLEFNFDGCSTAEKKQAIFQTGKIETSGNADGSWEFTGTYEFIHWSNPNYIEAVGDGLIYGFAGSNEKGIAKGQFGRVDYSAEINPLRCYLRKKSSDVKLQPQTLAKAAPQVLKAAPYSISLLPETIDVKFVDKDENGEHTTAIGRMDPRTGKIRLLHTDRTYDLKGRRVNDVNRAAKGAYYGKKL